MKQPTPQEVRDFWSYMTKRFNTKVVDKASAVEMQLIAYGLDLIGIQDKDTFLSRFTTTIGRSIYMPQKVGEGPDLWEQIVLCTHEHQHVVQHDREGMYYDISYLANSAARAHWEAEAYRCNLELTYWRTGKVPSGDQLSWVLGAYGCNKNDITVASQLLDLSAVSVLDGAIVSEATSAALEYLNEHLSHLRA